MKISSLFLPALLLCAVPSGPLLAEPVAPKASSPTSALPAEVATAMSVGSKSLHLKIFPMGGRPILLHFWTLVRGGIPKNEGGVTPQATPVFVDLFKPGAAQGSWFLANTAICPIGSSLTGDAKTEHITVRWLQPKKKQGLVVVVTGSDENGTKTTLITFATGTAQSPNYGVVNQFYARSDDGNGSTFQRFAVDGRGFLMIEDIFKDSPRGNNDGQPAENKTVYKWDGYAFVGGTRS